jgi:hypothetical protein
MAEVLFVQAEMAAAYGSAALKIEGSADGIRFTPISFDSFYRP